MAHHVPDHEERHGSSLLSTLRLSQQAPITLNQQRPSILHQLGLVQNDSASFFELERQYFACLQSADDTSALQCLDRLTSRFGPSNERVMALRGLYEEAIAKDQTALANCLHKYDAILSESPPILKRRIALLRSLSKPADAILNLVQLLEAVPTDAEAWCELADLYQSQGMGLQAIFSLEEALLIVPNSWSVHARLGEVLYIYAYSANPEGMEQILERSIQHFCRSIELCDGYLRALYGLALATSLLLGKKDPGANRGNNDSSNETRMQLHIFAKKNLESIIIRQHSFEMHLREYEENEILAVKELLDRF